MYVNLIARSFISRHGTRERAQAHFIDFLKNNFYLQLFVFSLSSPAGFSGYEILQKSSLVHIIKDKSFMRNYIREVLA